MARSSTHIVTVANIKGGVGKTSATVNLAYLLSQDYGKKVLVIDADDQGNASKVLGTRGQFDMETETLWHALKNKKNYQSVLVDTPYENLWVVPATKELRQAQVTFGQSARGIKLFKRFLNGIENEFDFVFIDTKPQVNVLLQAALAASDWYLIPSFPESDSYDGFIDLVAEAEEIYEEENPELSCLGVLFTCYKKSPAHDSYLNFIRSHLKKAGIPVLPTAIRSSNAMATGALQNRPSVSLPTARNLKDDYTDAVQHIFKTIKQRSTRLRKRPNLEALGLSSKSIDIDSGMDFVAAASEDAFADN